jgi:hypothetical protein
MQDAAKQDNTRQDKTRQDEMDDMWARLAARTLGMCIDACCDLYLDTSGACDAGNFVDAALSIMTSQATWSAKEKLVTSRFGVVRLADLVVRACEIALDFEATNYLSREQIEALEVWQVRFCHESLTKVFGNVYITFK